MTNPQSLPDLEVYVASKSLEPIIQWLSDYFDQLTPFKRRGMPKNAQSFQAQKGDQQWPVILMENVVPGFSSVWIDSPNAPWPDDQTLARALFASLNLEVRATAGGWQTGDEPDKWWCINEDGEAEIHWKS